MTFKLGKSSLSFRVIAASAVPEVGNENIVVVVSDVPMTNWTLSPRAPEGLPRRDGDVWLQYSTVGGNFNLLKTNVMMVIIMSAKQYIDGEWVDKDFEVHQGGTQEGSFNGIMYIDGEAFDGLTFNTNSYLTITEMSGYMKVYLSANSQGRGLTAKKYDLTPYSKLTVRYEGLSANASCGVLVYKDGSQVKSNSSSTTSGTVSVDISDLSGEHEVGISMYSESGGKECKVTYFALEK